MIEVTEEALRSMPAPNQILQDWKTYLRFLQGYCRDKNITKPIVVEIGTQAGAQKIHYQRFLDAEHIGMDVTRRTAKHSQPDIVGNSHDPQVVKALADKLSERKINVLFIDGGHAYGDVACDWYAYAPMVSDIIALHDIRHEKEIGQFWQELIMAHKGTRTQFIKIGAWGNGWCELGIGLVLFEGNNG